jgi:hypothetical protein
MYYKLKAPCVPEFEASGGGPPKSKEEQERAAEAKRVRDMERLEEQRARGNVILPPAPGPLPLVEHGYRGAPQPQQPQQPQPQQPQPQQPQPQQPHMYYKLKAPCVPEFEASGVGLKLNDKIKKMEGFGEKKDNVFDLERWKEYLRAEALTSKGKKYHPDDIEPLATVLNKSVTVPYRIVGLAAADQSDILDALIDDEKKSVFENLLLRKVDIWQELLSMRVAVLVARANRIHWRNERRRLLDARAADEAAEEIPRP